MANIKVTIDFPIVNGQPLTFKSPADCSQVTGLVVSYPEGGENKTKSFQFADAHGNNVGDIDLFASDVLVKVILDVDASKAYVQNADTNAYLEGRFDGKVDKNGNNTLTGNQVIVGTSGVAPLKLRSATVGRSILSFDDLNVERMGSVGFYEKNVFGVLIDDVMKTVLHTGNKPSGSYTGNGSEESRTIPIGGIGRCCAIRKQGGSSVAFVFANCFIAKPSTGSTTAVFCGSNDAVYTDGNLTITSINDAFNTNGKTYEYQVF